jgi:AraC-like DNA-binding protein
VQLSNPPEKLYSPKEVAGRLGISPSRAQRIFRDYPGVLRFHDPKPGRRPYVTRRIPESVLERWIREHTLPEQPPRERSLSY